MTAELALLFGRAFEMEVISAAGKQLVPGTTQMIVEHRMYLPLTIAETQGYYDPDLTLAENDRAARPRGRSAW